MKATDKPQINIRLEPEQMDKLDFLSYKFKASKTLLVKTALEQYFENHDFSSMKK